MLSLQNATPGFEFRGRKGLDWITRGIRLPTCLFRTRKGYCRAATARDAPGAVLATAGSVADNHHAGMLGFDLLNGDILGGDASGYRDICVLVERQAERLD